MEASSNSNESIVSTTLAPRNDIDKYLELSKSNTESIANLTQSIVGLANGQARMMQDIASISQRMDDSDNSRLVTPSQKRILNRCVGHRIYRLLDLKVVCGRLTPECKPRSEVYSKKFYSRLYRELNERFGVSSYEEIKAVDFDDAKDFINTWEPEYGISDLKQDAEESWKMKHPDESLSEFLGILPIE